MCHVIEGLWEKGGTITCYGQRSANEKTTYARERPSSPASHPKMIKAC